MGTTTKAKRPDVELISDSAREAALAEIAEIEKRAGISPKAPAPAKAPKPKSNGHAHTNGRVTPKAMRVATLDDLYGRQPRRQSVPVYLNEDTYRAYEDAAKAVTLTEAAETKAAFDEAKEALDTTTVWVTFQEVPRPDYDALVTSNPASEEKDKEHRERFGYPAPYDTDTFPIALVAASAVEPVMTEEQVSALWDKWPFSELQRLWMAALSVNSQARNVTSLGKGWSGTTS